MSCYLEDFLGNINVRVGNYTVGVFDGKTAVTVNHTFLGVHVSLSGWGYEQWRYSSPAGVSETLIRLFLANKKITLTDTPECILGEAGTCYFELDLLQWGELFTSKYWCPGLGMSLFGADVKLP